MNITFIFPGFIKVPMGGVKVIHEYANRLADKGHDVTLVYPLSISKHFSLRGKLKQVYDNKTGVNNDLYYTPNPNVSVLVVDRAVTDHIPFSDAVIATGWQTASWVNDLPEKHGKKYYFLQHFETHFRQKRKVLKTYKLPLIKITIARWIIDRLNKMGETALGPMGNAVDIKEYFVENTSKRNIDVLMLYHHLKIKGGADGLKALSLLKKQNPSLKAEIIAPRIPTEKIPGWIKVNVRPEIDQMRQIYNSAKVFLHSSHWEGWGLPPMEAIACGCAVAASENLGVKEFLIHQENALLSPISQPEILAKDVAQLLENEALRKSLIEMGQKTVASYSWEKIVDKFEEILKSDAE